MLKCYLLILFFIQISHEQVTLKKNPLLSRRKRYLLFPQGSNFVMTMSVVKAVMIKVPRLVNVLGECDVPFKLPSDPRQFRTKGKSSIHRRQRREVYSQLEEALTSQGFHGNACVKRMICDAQNLLPPKGKSLVADILHATFTISLNESFGDDYCNKLSYENCQIPLMELIMGSLIP